MVEESVKNAEFVSVREDFGFWERLEHFVKWFLETKERVEETRDPGSLSWSADSTA